MRRDDHRKLHASLPPWRSTRHAQLYPTRVLHETAQLQALLPGGLRVQREGLAGLGPAERQRRRRRGQREAAADLSNERGIRHAHGQQAEAGGVPPDDADAEHAADRGKSLLRRRSVHAQRRRHLQGILGVAGAGDVGPRRVGPWGRRCGEGRRGICPKRRITPCCRVSLGRTCRRRGRLGRGRPAEKQEVVEQGGGLHAQSRETHPQLLRQGLAGGVFHRTGATLCPFTLQICQCLL
mmetsp:Transcript_5977/g.17286  ORF Transcript_5977/g.17286 Transcript_5977/m.17286 type:complete len:238 (+) Transcript_5977:663-1376(+)